MRRSDEGEGNFEIKKDICNLTLIKEIFFF